MCKRDIHLELEAVWIWHPGLHIQNKRLVRLRDVHEEVDETVSDVSDGVRQVHLTVDIDVTSLYDPHRVSPERTRFNIASIMTSDSNVVLQ